MRIYLAAPWVKKAEAAEARRRLDAAGFLVDAPWIDQHGDTEDHAELQRQAHLDAYHVRRCDTLVILNLAKSEGKATELGMALALGHKIVLVGPRTINVFYHSAAVEQVNNIEEAIVALHQHAGSGRRPRVPTV